MRNYVECVGLVGVEGVRIEVVGDGVFFFDSRFIICFLNFGVGLIFWVDFLLFIIIVFYKCLFV